MKILKIIGAVSMAIIACIVLDVIGLIIGLMAPVSIGGWIVGLLIGNIALIVHAGIKASERVH